MSRSFASESIAAASGVGNETRSTLARKVKGFLYYQQFHRTEDGWTEANETQVKVRTACHFLQALNEAEGLFS